MRTYIFIADALEADILAGRLAPGQRLPPQRDFAYRQGIAASTASRVYAELSRRGLVSGEVGRGTFVRPAVAQPPPTLSEPSIAPVDLEMNVPVLADALSDLSAALIATSQIGVLRHAVRAIGPRGTPEARTIAAASLARGSWMPEPESLVFTGNGKQALSAALATLARPGERLGVEALTYPVVKSAAVMLGIQLVPLEVDDRGVMPRSILDAHSREPLVGLYLQPTLQNPLGVSMDTQRRAEIARTLRDTGLTAIEDGIYGFLVDEEPLAACASDNIIFVDSLSKRIAPGMSLGFLAAPSRLRNATLTSVRRGSWGPSGVALSVALDLMMRGAVAGISHLKREDAARRQALARRVLTDLDFIGDSRAYHLWLRLPEPWRAEAFVAAAAERGIGLAPGSAFAVAAGHAPNAVRLALSAPGDQELADALGIVRQLALRTLP